MKEVRARGRPSPVSPAKAGSGARAAAHTLLSRVVQQGINAATGIISARALKPAGRGELAAITLWWVFLAGLTTFGLPASLIYTTKRTPDRRAELNASGLAMSLLAGVATALVAACFMPAWLHQYPAWVISGARWSLILVPLCAVTLFARAVLEANGQFLRSNLQQLIVPVLTLAGLLAALSLHRLTVIAAALCYTVIELPAFVSFCIQLRPYFQSRQFPSMWGCRTLLKYGIRSWGIDLLGTMGAQIDQVLVIRLLAPADMGAYVVMLSLSGLLNVIQGSVVTVLFPKASGLEKADAIRVTGRAARVASLATLLCGIAVGLAGPALLKFFYGREYIHSVGTFRLLLVVMFFGGLNYTLSQAFMALGRPGTVTVLSAVGLATTVPAMLWLIPKWGVFGAAASLLLSTLVGFGLILASFRLVLKTSPPNLLVTPQDVRYLFNTLFGRRAPSTAA